jgi:hypothetical protein
MVGGVDVGDAPLVAQDFDRRAEAREAQCAFGDRAGATVEERETRFEKGNEEGGHEAMILEGGADCRFPGRG